MKQTPGGTRESPVAHGAESGFSAEHGELTDILSAHAAKYPLMKPQDAVKLLYQNEFGGGHLLADETGSLERLREEWRRVHAAESVFPCAESMFPCEDSVSRRTGNIVPWEDIGNGFVRIYLSGLDTSVYSLEQMNHDFVRSGRLHSGTMRGFAEKLDILRRLAQQGMFPFPAEELRNFLETYTAAGCPMLSHSAEYRAAYAPAYRVILRRTCAPLLTERILTLESRNGTWNEASVLIAIDGRCAAGKSTFAGELARRYGWNLIHMDDFFPQPEQRTPQRLSQPGGNVDYERVRAEVLEPLRGGKTVCYSPFDCQSMSLRHSVTLPPRTVTLVEGSYACHPVLRDFYDLRVFLTVSPDVQAERILRRNGPEQARTFRERWIPMEERYFSAFSIEQRCDAVLERVF